MNPTRLLASASVLALLATASCANNPPPPPPAQAAAPAVAPADANFINTIAQASSEEIAAAQLAEKQSHSKRVLAYAQQMISDHTQANQQLMSIAQSKGVTPTTTPDDAHQQMMTQLQGEHGRAFDRAYMQGQVQDHQMVVSTLQNYIDTGTDPQLKQFAQQTLPIIQHHEQMAQSILASYSSTGHHYRHHHHAASSTSSTNG